MCARTFVEGRWMLFNVNHFLAIYRHIPKAKATTIAETPELRRIAENTKIQSNVKYHAEFEKTKGKLTQVRFHRNCAMINSKNIKRKSSESKSSDKNKFNSFHFFISSICKIADDPETLRIKQNTKNFSNVAYHGDIQKKAAMERQRELTEIVDNRGK